MPKKKGVSTEKVPRPIGPYQQAVAAGGLLFLSGQVGIEPSTGRMVRGGVEAQTKQILENLKAVLEAAGASLNDVVRVAVYLTDMGDFQKVNAIYSEYFGESKPARSAIGVASLPAGALVEMDAIAVL